LALTFDGRLFLTVAETTFQKIGTGLRQSQFVFNVSESTNCREIVTNNESATKLILEKMSDSTTTTMIKLLIYFNFLSIKGTETARCHRTGDRKATDPPKPKPKPNWRKSHGKNNSRQDPINGLVVRMIKN